MFPSLVHLASILAVSPNETLIPDQIQNLLSCSGLPSVPVNQLGLEECKLARLCQYLRLVAAVGERGSFLARDRDHRAGVTSP